MKSNQVQDQGRPAGRSGSASVPIRAQADGSDTAESAPVARIRPRWTVRIHWGIIFAVVASVLLWLGIKALFDLAF